MVWPNNLTYAFSWVNQKVLVTKNYCENSSSMFELFPFKETEFPYKEVTQNFKNNFLKKTKTKTKKTHRLDFCPKPLDYVPLNFPLKNQSLIETKIIYC